MMAPWAATAVGPGGDGGASEGTETSDGTDGANTSDGTDGSGTSNGTMDPRPATRGWSNDQITADANYSGGGGGKGLRHFRGDGTNNNGGGLRISLPAPVSEMWVRVLYMRYSAGFSWTFAPDSHPHYTKEFYWNVNGGGNPLIFGYQGGGWGLNNNGNHPSSLRWYE